jgi:hypothetical protein
MSRGRAVVGGSSAPRMTGGAKAGGTGREVAYSTT